MRHPQESRNPGRSDIDLELERRGTMRDLEYADRAAFVRVAELLGCHTAAEHILADAHRRRLIVAAPEPAPRPGPKPRPTAARPPLLRLLVNDGDLAVEVDDRASFYFRMARLAEDGLNADWPDLNERVEMAGLARDLRAAAIEHFVEGLEVPPPPSAA